jgi:hypothetical protein
VLLNSAWTDAKDDDRCIAWCRDGFKALEKYFTGAYFNFTPDEVDKVFQKNKSRLMEVYFLSMSQ